jgi:hypothetical protein
MEKSVFDIKSNSRRGKEWSKLSSNGKGFRLASVIGYQNFIKLRLRQKDEADQMAPLAHHVT